VRSGVRYRISGLRCQVSDIRCRQRVRSASAHGDKSRALSSQWPVLSFGYQLLAVSSQLRATSHELVKPANAKVYWNIPRRRSPIFSTKACTRLFVSGNIWAHEQWSLYAAIPILRGNASESWKATLAPATRVQAGDSSAMASLRRTFCSVSVTPSARLGFGKV
jgi:hypothetical protein